MPHDRSTSARSLRVRLDALSSIESYVPEALQEFLQDLNLAPDRDAVWGLLESLCERLGQRYVLYRFVLVRPPGGGIRHRRSNLPADWTRWVESLPEEATLDYGLNHAIHKLTAFAIGIEFADQYRRAGFLSPHYETLMTQAARIGWRSGLLIPLRTSRREERGTFIIGGGQSEAEFRAFVAEHGWTVSVAALQAHLKYTALLLQEEAESYELTPRQLEFLHLSANGYEVKEIAFHWGVSVQYVTRVRRDICDRMGTKSKMAVMAKAVRLDLLTEEDFEIAQAMSTSWS
ncbi:MAG: hypothetical protein EP318_16475 [Rhodobacteraceae bacterium]|nr:MAG: hypothetical protein EP318_16475 [Paracoccaceae bacterium]